MGIRSHAATAQPRPRPRGPGAFATLGVALVSLLLLVASGRPVGDAVTGGAAGWLWAAASALVGTVLELDEAGRAIVGKLLAALFAASAAGFLFAAVARRHPMDDARWSAFALALGTTLAAAAQAWSGEAAAACAVAAALWLVTRAEDPNDAALAARAGLPLGLAVAAQPAALALAVVFAGGGFVRWRRAALPLLAWVVPGALVAIAALVWGGPGPGAAPDPGLLALIVSPAKGLLVFAPVALVGAVGLGRALRGPRRLWDQPEPGRTLPVACGLAFLAHVAALALVGGWADGAFWGPRGLAPAWPLLLFFLPEGLAVLKLAGTALVVASVGVQALGVLAYDGRWDRLNRGPHGELGAVTWDAARSPLAFQLRERVARPALLGLEGRRLVAREHAVVRGGTSGSFVAFGPGGLRPTGVDATMEALRLERGARVEGDRLLLREAGDGIAFRVREGVRLRRLELRIVGRGTGTLAVGEKGFWQGARWRERPLSGGFRLRFPYAQEDAAGPDLTVVLRAGGPVSIESVALVPPGDPENVLRLP